MRGWVLLAAACLCTPVAAPVLADDGTEEIAATCVACHGEDGQPISAEIPIIFGQQEGYLCFQIRDFKTGARKSEVMSPLVADLTKDQMKALAAYFAAKTWPRLMQSATPEQKAAALQADTAAGCTGCHLEGYVGASTAPRLAGQQPTYLDQTLGQFKTKARANNPGMSGIMPTFSDDAISAISAYLAALYDSIVQRGAGSGSRVVAAARSNAALPSWSRRSACAPAASSVAIIALWHCSAAIISASAPARRARASMPPAAAACRSGRRNCCPRL